MAVTQAKPRKEMDLATWRAELRRVPIKYCLCEDTEETEETRRTVLLDLIRFGPYDLDDPQYGCQGFDSLMLFRDLQDDYRELAFERKVYVMPSEEQWHWMFVALELRCFRVEKLDAGFEVYICGLSRKYKVVPPSLQSPVKRAGDNMQHAAKRQKMSDMKQTFRANEEQKEDQEHVTDSLYLMKNSEIPNQVKVGRSQDVTARRKNLDVSQNFNILVHADFPGYGHLEQKVHEALKDYQVKNVRGKEWFRCSVAHAMKAIASVMSPSDNEKEEEEEECLSPPSRGWEAW